MFTRIFLISRVIPQQKLRLEDTESAEAFSFPRIQVRLSLPSHNGMGDQRVAEQLETSQFAHTLDIKGYCLDSEVIMMSRNK